MSDTAIACKSCGSLFIRRTARGDDECPHCSHRGNKVKYVNGSESRKDWYETVELEVVQR